MMLPKTHNFLREQLSAAPAGLYRGYNPTNAKGLQVHAAREVPARRCRAFRKVEHPCRTPAQYVKLSRNSSCQSMHNHLYRASHGSFCPLARPCTAARRSCPTRCDFLHQQSCSQLSNSSADSGRQRCTTPSQKRHQRTSSCMS